MVNMANKFILSNPNQGGSRRLRNRGGSVGEELLNMAGSYVMRKGVPVLVDAFGNAIETVATRGGNAIKNLAKTVGSRRRGKKSQPSGDPDPTTTVATAPSDGKRKKRSKSKGRGGNGSGRRTTFDVNDRGIDVDLRNNHASNVGFGVPAGNTIPATIQSEIDTSLYENSYRSQSLIGDNAVNYSRTLFCIIEPLAIEGADFDSVIGEIFSAYRQEMLSNTNGGNSVVTSLMTKDNFVSYIRNIYELYSHLVELQSRMAWASTDPVPNKVLRRAAGWITNQPDLLLARNLMASQLSNYVLPKGMYDYARWIFQTHKSNEHPYAIDQTFMSIGMAKLLTTYDAATYTEYINQMCSSVDANDQTYSQLSALFESKTTGSWVSLSVIQDPISTSAYDISFNDIFNNMIISVPSNDGSKVSFCPTTTAQTQNAVGCFENDVNSLPIHVSETMFHRFGAAYHPVMFEQAWYPTGVEDRTSSAYFNFFVGYESNTLTGGFLLREMDQASQQIGNQITRIWRNNDTTTGGAAWCDYQIAPRGDQSFLYEFSYNNIMLAKRRFVEQMLN